MNSPDTPVLRQQNARRIAIELLAEHSSVDQLDEDAVLSENPGCAKELREELRRIRIIRAARATDDVRRTRSAIPEKGADNNASPTGGLQATYPPLKDTDVRMTVIGSDQDVPVTLSSVADGDPEVDTDSDWQDVDIVDQPTRRFRPSMRPPLALIRVWNDNQRTGELVRVPGDRFTIGRSQADLVIAHDIQLSGTHAEIVRSQYGLRFCWCLRDLDSTNGTYVKIRSLRLRDGMELFLGSQRCQFEQSQAGASLSMCAPDGHQDTVALHGSELLIGRTAAAPDCMRNDLMLGPSDGLILEISPGCWILREDHSLNGIWSKIKEVPLTDGCQFQVGEQRLGFYFP